MTTLTVASLQITIGTNVLVRHLPIIPTEFQQGINISMWMGLLQLRACMQLFLFGDLSVPCPIYCMHPMFVENWCIQSNHYHACPSAVAGAG